MPLWVAIRVSTMCLSMAINRARLLSAVLGSALTLIATAVQAEAGATDVCHFGAFVEERDPAGLNVREAPHAKAKIMGSLPPVWFDKKDGLQERVEVEVVESRNGWFRIRHAEDFSRLTGREPRPTFSGEGWVSGSKLSVKTQALRGRAAPSTKASTLLQIGDGEPLDSDALMEASRPIDCDGEWVRLEFTEKRLPSDLRAALQIAPDARKGAPAGRFRVWVNRICAIQETTCDGRGVDDDVDAGR